jgi:abortive infection bacteriophage resistance protein
MKEKKFLNTKELIAYIKQKGIVVSDERKVADILNSENYYVLFGYKTLFVEENGNYKSNTNFMDIYKLSQFDRSLRMLLFDTILTIENKVKTSIVNTFCSKYGYKEIDFFDINNYNKSHKYLTKTFAIMKRQMEEKRHDHLAILHYAQEYGFVPLWVYMKLFSFGLVKEMYNILKDEDKRTIKNNISNDANISIKNIFTMIHLLVDTRNDCGHDEIVFNHIHRRLKISKTDYHKLFDNPYQGKGDMLAKLISIKCFLSKEKFNSFMDKFILLINDFIKDGNILRDELLAEMHLPNNYESLKW